jgi:hypothetical protein
VYYDDGEGYMQHALFAFSDAVFPFCMRRAYVVRLESKTNVEHESFKIQSRETVI